MKKYERILQDMRMHAPRRLFRTMELAGGNGTLFTLVEKGLISSRDRCGRGNLRFDWYLTEAQHAAIKPVPIAELVRDTLDVGAKDRWPFR